MGKINFLILLFAAVLCCNSCKLYKVSYSTTGASISPDVKTFSVDYFPNKAPLVVPYLSSLFTEKLTDYMRSKTGLSQLTDNNGDIRFEGQITEYSQRPIKVKYTNTKDDKYDFSSTFSNYADYSTDADFNSIEESLIIEILDKIIDDIYNKALVNW